jgi:aryl carrier-like protein
MATKSKRPATSTTNKLITTLQQHTDALKAHTAALTKSAPINARQLVYSVLRDSFPTATLKDTTNLSDLGYDEAGLAALAARIRAQGVEVDTGAIQDCTTIGDVIAAVQAAAK